MEPNDLESKEEEESQEEPQKEVMAEEQTLTRISPVEEESVTKVEVTNKSSVHEEEPSVEQKMDSFEEFVTLVESEELPKKEVTTSVEHNPTDDVGSPKLRQLSCMTKIGMTMILVLKSKKRIHLKSL